MRFDVEIDKYISRGKQEYALPKTTMTEAEIDQVEAAAVMAKRSLDLLEGSPVEKSELDDGASK